MGFMVVRSEKTKKIFLDEIAILLIENPAVALTGCLLEALVEKKIRVIFCDAKRTPNAELVPHHNSYDTSRKIKKLAIGPLIRALSPEIADNEKNTLETIFTYMELVRELDRDRLFIMVNMRSYFSDEDMGIFTESVSLHDFKVLLLESISLPSLPYTKRYTIDEDLCEF